MAAILLLAFEPSSGADPVTLARVEDRTLLVQAASAAIKESRQRDGQFEREDATLGVLQREESARLERALNFAIPELGAAQFTR